MINECLRWVKGSVCFDAELPDLSLVIDDVRAAGLRVWSLKSHGIVVQGLVRAKDYRAFAKIIRRYGGRVRITKRKGFPFVRFRHRKRIGLLLGALFFAAFLGYTQLYLWEIRIPPCEPQVEAQLRELLTEHGVVVGSKQSELDEKVLQQEMLRETTNFSWVALNFHGTSVEVGFAERVQQPTIGPNTPCDIVARKAGQVLYIESTHGTETVSEKEVVLPGDLLISGVSSSSDQLQHAEGRVIAETVTTKTQSFSLTQTAKQFSGDKTYRLQVDFFGLTVPFWDQKPQENYDEAAVKYPLTLFGHELPIALTVTERSPYQTVHEEFSEEQALDFLKQSFLDYEKTELALAKILGYQEKVTVRDGVCFVTRLYRCEENIVQKISLSVNE